VNCISWFCIVSVSPNIKVVACGQTMLLAYLPTTRLPLAGYGVK